MSFLKTATLAAFAFTALATPVRAVSTCATDTDMAAFRTAAVQQQLMVAALTCHDVEAYNRFVLAYQPELQKSDADLKAYYIRRGNEAEYDTFKTKLANLSSLSDIANGPAYCSNAAAAFDMALKSRQALSSFVADQRLMIAMPKQTMCSENKSAGPVLEAAAARPPLKLAEPAEKVRVAAATPVLPSAAHPAAPSITGVPGHELPASPYGGAATYTYKETASAAPPSLTHAYKEEEETAQPPAAYVNDQEDEDLPLPPRPQTAAARRAEAYYAAQYANTWSRNRWAPSDADDYYGGR